MSCLLERNWGITHEELREIGRVYLILQEKRQAAKQALDAKPRSSTILAWAESQLRMMKEEIVKRFVEKLEDHPILDWCRRVKGLGPVSALVYSAFINPHICTSPAKVFAYWALTPLGKRVRGEGERFKGRPELKRNAWYFATNVIMKKDPYYMPIFLAKKEYYKSRGDIETERKVDGKARFFLTKILLANAWEMMREGCGLPGAQHKHPCV